jgi:hypothetical protein
MTPAHIEEIKARHAAVTRWPAHNSAGAFAELTPKATAFAARAHDDVRSLLAEVERLREIMGQLARRSSCDI